ncbi:MAG TPA: nuclear transport factor 2 family protein [Puia sp.]|nr:nuclear transport factor 2 family protein [Puia sp.]
MTTKNHAVPTAISAKDTVLSFIEALNDEDFKGARNYVKDDFAFSGVMGSRDGADAYFKDMEKMRMKYKIRKTFATGNDVCLLFDFTQGGLTIFGCGWYQVEDGKINTYRVVFDPRPILEAQEKKQDKK